MAKIIGKLCAPTGKYIKDGEEKTSWTRCGILMETDRGFRVKLDTIPVGGTENGVWFSVFEDEQPKSSGSQQKPRSQATQDVPEDDLPF